MISVKQPSVKGWCPGALKPMESGDGLLVRVRARCGAFSTAGLTGLAELAEHHGNGHLDLTRRGNIQMRGVGVEDLPDLWTGLDQLGLMDANVAAEAVRNVLVSPLAGLDRAEVLDVRPIAATLADALGRMPSLWVLPGKFGFVVDGGGVLPLDGERGDIRLRAVETSDGVKIAVGADQPDGPAWLRLVPPDVAAEAAVRLAEAFIALPKSDPRLRMRAISAAMLESLRHALEEVGEPVGNLILPNGASSKPLGRIVSGEKPIAVGVAAPFGRLNAAALKRICETASACDVEDIRVSPWRSLYIPAPRPDIAEALLAAAADYALIAQPDDPVLVIDACPGAPACRSTVLDTRAAAYLLAPVLRELGCSSAHISGCAKGCARSGPADLVLVGDGASFGVIRHGTVQGMPRAFLRPGELHDLRRQLRIIQGS